MGKAKLLAILFATAILAACMGGCSSEQNDTSSASEASSVASETSALASAPASSAAEGASNPAAISVADNMIGEWTCTRLFYGHNENGEDVTTGRYEGDGVLTVSEHGYEFEFAYPDGQVALSSRGTFTTGVQASYLGDTTISDYPIAMLSGSAHDGEIKFLTEDFNEWVVASVFK